MKHRFREAGTAIREALAIKQDADIFGLFFNDPVQENYMVNGACVVTVRGPLEHHACAYGENYEALVDRFREAMASDAPAVILCIDSPGGVVSGLTQCVADLRAVSIKPVYAYVNEMACSAAYALACAATEIIVPPSAIVGSIGVISMMIDQVGLDKDMGVNVVTITSGARKADGHPHVGITDAAVAAEQGRVDKLAGQFFKLVAQARPLTPEQIQAQQAAIFLGQDAVNAGLADDVLGWREFLAAVAQTHGTGAPPKKEVAQPGTTTAHSGRGGPNARGNMLKLQALIAHTKKLLIAEGDASKRKAIAAEIATYEATLQAVKKTKIKYEETSTVDGDEEEEEKAAEAAEKDDEEPDASAAASSDDDKDAAAKDDKPDAAKADDEEEAKALAHLTAIAAKSGGKVSAALANLLSEAAASKQLARRVESIEKRNQISDRDAKINAALEARKITKAEAKELRGKPLAFVTEYLSMRKVAIVRGPQDALAPGKPGDIDNGYPDAGGTGAHFTPAEEAENERMIADIVARSNGKVTREMVMKDFHARLGTLNGGPKGRY